MKFETKLNVGDTAFTMDYNTAMIHELTVGEIKVKYIGESSKRLSKYGDNFGPQEERYEELYMCYETGIGSGSVYTLGDNFFSTEIECAEYGKERIIKITAAKREAEQRELENIKQNLKYYQDQVEHLKAYLTRKGEVV